MGCAVKAVVAAILALKLFDGAATMAGAIEPLDDPIILVVTEIEPLDNPVPIS